MTRRERIRAALAAHPEGVLVAYLAAVVARPGAPARVERRRTWDVIALMEGWGEVELIGRRGSGTRADGMLIRLRSKLTFMGAEARQAASAE